MKNYPDKKNMKNYPECKELNMHAQLANDGRHMKFWTEFSSISIRYVCKQLVSGKAAMIGSLI